MYSTRKIDFIPEQNHTNFNVQWVAKVFIPPGVCSAGRYVSYNSKQDKNYTCNHHTFFGGHNSPYFVNFQAILQLLCNVITCPHMTSNMLYIRVANTFVVSLDFHQVFSEFAEIHLGKKFHKKL